jgi:FecR protein
MSKSFLAGHALIISLLVLSLTATKVLGDDRFALAVGEHGDLVVFGPKGDKVADLPIPSISQPVTINGTTTFQVSYGRDANDLLTAIIAPNPTQPQNLHFNVLNKNIDADKMAVVTLTFSSGLNHVSVDPGYIGLVQVNSRSLRHHDLADDSSPSPAPELNTAPSSSAPSYTPPPPRMNPDVTTRDLPSSPSAGPVSYNPAPANPNPSTEDPTPPMASPGIAPASLDPSAATSASQPPLFWSEPITGPDGSAPSVGENQMRLVEVHGDVSVQTAGGGTLTGREGMIVPSGSVVSTSSNSSAAVFIGGVDSARLLPDSDVQVSQHLAGSVRHTTLNLQKGTVFSRVGRRPGETQKYEVQTPQGVAAARGTEFASTLHGGHSYTFVQNGFVPIYQLGHLIMELHGAGSSDIGMGAIPPADDLKEVLHEILLLLQPFNTKTNAIFFRIRNHTATPAEIAYYTAALYTALVDNGFPPGRNTYLDAQLGAIIAAGLGDLVPIKTPPPASSH